MSQPLIESMQEKEVCPHCGDYQSVFKVRRPEDLRVVDIGCDTCLERAGWM